ncbi:MAG: glycosyltransferase family 2 protein [Sphingobium sp.]
MVAPLVSVLIPTFNRAHYLGAAITSALTQTLTDIEVVVVDDGSIDATRDLLATIDDNRLRVVPHSSNRGIPAARNTALATATGKYTAWLDSDDIARPTRLAEQVAFLETHPSIAMVGACAGKLCPDGTPKSGIRVPPFTPEMIAAWLLFRSAFQQSSVTGQTDILKRYQYDPDCPVCEDVDMFLRLQQDHRLANLPRVLIDRRLHPEQSVRQRQQEISGRTMVLVRPMLQRLGIEPGEEDLRRHVLLGKANLQGAAIGADFLDWARNWLERIRKANLRTGVLDHSSLKSASEYFWLLACRAMASRIGSVAALRAVLAHPPVGLASTATLGWISRAMPAYLSRHNAPVGFLR